MIDYYGTYGQKVQYLSSDPPAPQTGQVWYNSTSATLKVRQVGTVNAWASGGNMNTARYYGAAAGTQTSTLLFGGDPGKVTTTESYNGTSWSPVSSLNTGRSGLAGAGTQTAALALGGEAPGGNTTATELYNGTSWTSNPTGVNTAARGLSAVATSSIKGSLMCKSVSNSAAEAGK